MNFKWAEFESVVLSPRMSLNRGQATTFFFHICAGNSIETWSPYYYHSYSLVILYLYNTLHPLFPIKDFCATQYPPVVQYFVLHLSFVKTSKLKALNFPDPYLMHLKPSSTLGLPNKKQTTVSQVNSLAIIFLPQAEDMQVYKAFLWLESSKNRWWMWNLSFPPTFSPISQLQSISKWFSFSSFHLDW